MKTFKQFCFILENNRAPLYHGTSHEFAHDILKSGHIKSQGGRVSTTRDKKYAHDHSSVHGKDSVTFHLDHNKIKQRHQVKPADYHGGSKLPHGGDDDMDWRDPKQRRSESEESVKGKISTKHITHMSLNKKMDDKVKRKLVKSVAKHTPHIKITSH